MTALDLITDALIEIGAHDLGQAVPAEEAALALRKLNQMLDRWATSPSMYPVLPEVSVPLDGSASYTIGPTGDVVATRPIRIDRATCVDSAGFEYQVRVLSRPLWDDIPNKDVTGGPVSDVWYDATSTNGTVYVYPKADNEYTLKLDVTSSLFSFTSLSTASTLPVGYESAIVSNLAVELAPSFQRQAPAELIRRAAGAVRAIKRSNTEPLLVDVGLSGGEVFEIERGY